MTINLNNIRGTCILNMKLSIVVAVTFSVLPFNVIGVSGGQIEHLHLDTNAFYCIRGYIGFLQKSSSPNVYNYNNHGMFSLICTQ